MKQYLLAFGLLFSAFSTAQTPMMVVTEDLWPFNYLEDNEIKGSATLLVKRILKQSHTDYTLSILPWARSYQLALTEPNVLIYTINKTPTRENQFHWIAELPINVESNFYALRSNLPTTEKLTQLRIATLIDSVNDDFLTQNNYSRITRVSHIKQTVVMLSKQRVDLVISSEEAILQALKQAQMKRNDIIKVATAFTSKPAIAASLATPIARINKLKQTAQQIAEQENICQLMKVSPTQCIL